MINTRALLVLGAAGALTFGVPAVAQAAPSDPIDLGCTLLASGRVDCGDGPPPLYSICTVVPTLPDEGTLIRKSCQLYTREGNVPVGGPAFYVYPPNNPLPEPTYAPVSPITAAPAPVRQPVAVTSTAKRDASPRSIASPASQAAPQQASVAPQTASEATTPAPVAAEPVPDAPAPAAASGLPVSVWVAIAAAIVLVLALVWRPKAR